MIKIENKIKYKIKTEQLRINPVSYTHLDVYKRQIMYSLEERDRQRENWWEEGEVQNSV